MAAIGGSRDPFGGFAADATPTELVCPWYSGRSFGLEVWREHRCIHDVSKGAGRTKQMHNTQRRLVDEVYAIDVPIQVWPRGYTHKEMIEHAVRQFRRQRYAGGFLTSIFLRLQELCVQREYSRLISRDN